MKLSRTIPAHKKTVQFREIARKPIILTQEWKDIRSKYKNPLCSCFWCGHYFEIGEGFYLAFRERGRNVVLCAGCKQEAMGKEVEGD